MSKHKSQEKWIKIIEDAARSGMRITEFCRKNGIHENVFYRNSLILGYTKNGKRTEKWTNAVSSAETEKWTDEVSPAEAEKWTDTDSPAETEKWTDTVAPAETKAFDTSDHPSFIPVPVQTVQAAWRSSEPDARQSQISIHHDSFRIVVGEGFSQDTLRRVLEVMRDA